MDKAKEELRRGEKVMKNVIAFVLCLALIFVFVPTSPVYGEANGPYDVYVIVTGSGSVSYGGIVVTSSSAHTTTISATENAQITITPAPGYYVSSAAVKEGDYEEGIERDISLSNGALILTLGNYIESEGTPRAISIVFGEENLQDLVTTKAYAVVSGNAVEIASSLASEFAYSGYNIAANNISVSGISIPAIETLGYGTFNFKVSNEAIQLGYIVATGENVLFKYLGTKGSISVNQIRVSTGNGIENIYNIESGVPAMDTGTIQLIGVGNFGVEGLHSKDKEEVLDIEKRSLIRITGSFYRAQLHLGSNYTVGDEKLSWLKFYLIQDDAFCVKVSATTSGGVGEEVTWEWALNRYVDLTLGASQSDVYFGNDVVTLSLPADSAIGHITTLSAITGDFTGYSVTTGAVGSNTVKVTFLSNFYDEVDVELRINDNDANNRTITINRVGLYICEYENHEDYVDPCVNHGTQPGSKISFTSDGAYQVYATYYIPHYSSEPAYGLYVTYKWRDGTTNCEIITKAALVDSLESRETDEPHDSLTGVFTYKQIDSVSVSDYLLYGGTKASAPVSINVTVLKEAGNLTSFGGVTLGSGRGVTWEKK